MRRGDAPARSTPDSGRVRVRDDLSEVQPYGAPQIDVPVRLNTNETAEPPPDWFHAELASRVRALELNRYPDREHRSLREALARRHGVSIDRVWAANGSNEVLLQLLQAYGGPGRAALVFRPSYSMYGVLCRDAVTGVVHADLGPDLVLDRQTAVGAVVDHDPWVVLVGSPNNPVGSVVGHDVVREMHDRCRGLVVVDEAYVEFAPEGASVVPLLDELERLVVVRTFSKAFRLAGLRLGYLVAGSWVVDDVRKVRLPYHLDAVKQVAGRLALEREDAFLAHRSGVVSERDRMTEVLRRRGDVEVFPSAANFLLVRTAGSGVFESLLEHGVLVRDFSTAPRLEGCVRVTVGTPDENDALLAALGVVLGPSTG